MKEKKQPIASMVLGILSIVLSWLSWPAMIMAIVGLSIKKDETKRNRDIALNTIGLILSIIFFLIYLSIMGEV